MYNRPRIIPCLLLKDQGLVKTERFDKPRYLGDPINTVKIFNEKMVDELCLLDIEASKYRRSPDFAMLEDIASEAFMPLSYGGGITTIDDIRRLFSIGFEKVVINTAFIRDSGFIAEAAAIAGSQSVVVSIDAKRKTFGGYTTYCNDGSEKTAKSPVELARIAQECNAGEILLNSIDNDGTMKGYDLALVKEVTESVSIPVIACGGAGSIADLRRVIYEAGAHAASAGSMFVYYGSKKAVLINFPTEQELIGERVYLHE
ncbi:MAG: imidazole glycerol phosphate synthase subunit HisF [Actinobacteria bacterium]|nr:imidazole glycerol phosphate synthase subunit HisF [Actinomycetota bacterium]